MNKLIFRIFSGSLKIVTFAASVSNWSPNTGTGLIQHGALKQIRRNLMENEMIIKKKKCIHDEKVVGKLYVLYSRRRRQLSAGGGRASVP